MYTKESVKELDLDSHFERKLPLDEFYDLDNITQFITKNNYKKVSFLFLKFDWQNAKQVALQFPDILLNDSPKIVEHLKQTTEALTYVLGDTSYGSECVDEVRISFEW